MSKMRGVDAALYAKAKRRMATLLRMHPMAEVPWLKGAYKIGRAYYRCRARLARGHQGRAQMGERAWRSGR